MSGPLAAIHLLVPGLFGPVPGLELPSAIPSVPRLETLLARADGLDCPGGDLETTLFSFSALQPDPEGDYPAAALRRAGDGGGLDQDYWLQANPVHLRADRDRLLLFGGEELELSSPEAEQLTSLVAGHFAAEGWRIEVASPHRWYLTMDRIPRIRTRGLDAVYGRNIDQFLPAGPDAIYWHGLLNEIQMLLHATEVNRKREEQGRLGINGLWFSGGGRLPGGEIDLPFERVFGGALARGLAMAAGIPAQVCPKSSRGLSGLPDRSLVAYDGPRHPVLQADLGGWSAALVALDQWIDDLMQAVRLGQLAELILYPCNGKVYRLDRPAMRRFWRRRMPIGRYCSDRVAASPG